MTLCIERLKNRKNHPTIKSVFSGTKIIEEMVKKIEIPEIKEGFNEVNIINNFDDLRAIKNKFGFAFESKEIYEIDKIMKFPRTKHLVNLGSMTRDDLLYDPKDLSEFLKMDLIVEEKIDGANLGLFLIDNKIMAQNRSHFVNSAYHEQFKSLDRWIESHSIELYNIFSQGNFILFGEWVYMKHSINYTKLPDYFVLYDIYNKNTNEFLERKVTEKIIKESRIHMVPIIYEGKSTLDELKKLVNTKSLFYDGLVEGIYVRGCNNGIVKYRGKIVRHDFLFNGNTNEPAIINHWTKSGYVVNTLKF